MHFSMKYTQKKNCLQKYAFDINEGFRILKIYSHSKWHGV